MLEKCLLALMTTTLSSGDMYVIGRGSNGAMSGAGLVFTRSDFLRGPVGATIAEVVSL